jgi:hypothetical protein
MNIVKAGASLTTSPYQATQSEIVNSFQKTILENDPIYMSNAGNLYADMMKDIGNTFMGKPSDQAALLLSIVTGK